MPKKRKSVVKNLSVTLVGKLEKSGDEYFIHDGKEKIIPMKSFTSMLDFFTNETIRINIHVDTAGRWDVYEFEEKSEDNPDAISED